MSLKWFEGFDAQTDDTPLSLLFTSWSLLSGLGVASGGRRGGLCFTPSEGSGMYNSVEKAISGLGTDIIMGCARYQSAAYSTAGVYFTGSYGAIYLTINASNGIEVRKTSTGGTILAQSADGAYPGTGVWAYLEIRIKIGESDGIIQVKVNGTLVIDFAGDVRDTGSGDHSIIGLRGYSSFILWDDIYVIAVDATLPNDFLGDVAVEALLPNADGSINQWTPSAGSRYQCVDEVPVTDDTDYVTSSTQGEKQLFGVSLPNTGKPIKGVKLSSYARKTDAGFRNMRNIFKVGASEHDCADQPVYDSYRFMEDVLPLNPLTGLEFTDSDIDNGEFGVELRSQS